MAAESPRQCYFQTTATQTVAIFSVIHLHNWNLQTDFIPRGLKCVFGNLAQTWELFVGQGCLLVPQHTGLHVERATAQWQSRLPCTHSILVYTPAQWPAAKMFINTFLWSLFSPEVLQIAGNRTSCSVRGWQPAPQ